MTSSAGQRISCNVVETRRDDVARIFNIQRYSLNDGEGIRTNKRFEEAMRDLLLNKTFIQHDAGEKTIKHRSLLCY